jgi:hypothetical protein
MIDEWLDQMGYKQILNMKWVKPYAYSLIVVKIKFNSIEMSQWFIGINNKPLIWKRENWPIEEFKDVGHLQHMESEVTRAGGYFASGNYELLLSCAIL